MTDHSPESRSAPWDLVPVRMEEILKGFQNSASFEIGISTTPSGLIAILVIISRRALRDAGLRSVTPSASVGAQQKTPRSFFRNCEGLLR